MFNFSTVSPYLRQPIDRSYYDFLEEQIARLEAERQRIDNQLGMLREERERLGSRVIYPTSGLAIS